ncbi:cyclophilin-like fold protein [Curtobacterium sp. 314Chir4.1]|uniref:cyclophilin-like fold protein n=1 Tax=Curtobacterium sp. 314Chir4.1 TaxID=1279028 RepID=UPI00114275E0|nr:cyclophilin-like fold protein [Curtobacterium sp. 314Chir4.1]
MTTTHSATPTTESENMTAITIEFDGREVHGTLADNATARSLLAQLPLTLSFSDYGGQEKIARLSQPLSTDGAAAASDAPAWTIGYYVPNQALVLYYDDVGQFNGIVPIGTYDTAGDAITRLSEFTATIRKTS